MSIGEGSDCDQEVRMCTCDKCVFSVSHFSYLQHVRRPSSSYRVSDYTQWATGTIQCDSHVPFHYR